MKNWLAPVCAALCAIACGSNANCDAKSLAVTCVYPAAASECVDFSGLSTNDQISSQAACLVRGGLYDAGTCPAADRVGTCSIPPGDSNLDISCSPHGVILARFYGGADGGFTAAQAQAFCATNADAGFTPN